MGWRMEGVRKGVLFGGFKRERERERMNDDDDDGWGEGVVREMICW